MLRQNSGLNFQNQNKKEVHLIYFRKHLAFDVQPDDLLNSILYIFVCGDT